MTQSRLPGSNTQTNIYEVDMLATSDGTVVDQAHPLPVTLGNSVITITSNSVSVSVPNTISVNSSSDNPVHVHITEVGASGNLAVPYMPVGGNVTVTQNTMTSPWIIAGNVSVNNTVSVSGNVSVNNTVTVAGTVNANVFQSNGSAISNTNPLPVLISEQLPSLYSFNNFGIFSHRGWTMSDSLIPMFSVRAKSTATKTVKIINYDIGNNNANQSTIGYIWVENATITGTAPSWTSLNTEAEYRFYTDAYGSNTPNGFTGGTQRHAGIIIGKNSSAEEDIKDLELVANGITMTLCVMRLDSASKLDLWVAADLGIY